MKILLVILITIIGFCSSSGNSQPLPDTTDLEIRSILCRIKKSDFVGAQNALNTILQKDPQNIYARKLLPGILASQIIKDNKSPENIARIRKSIEAYKQVLNDLQISPKNRMSVIRYIITLYGKLSDEEKTNELLKRSADESLTAADRSDFYVSLGSQSHYCANEIIVDKTKLAKPEIEKAKSCVSKGLEYVNQAISLNADNESAWSYKASLFQSSAKIAGFENNLVQKAKSQKEYEEAVKQFKILSAKEKEKSKKVEEERERRLAEPAEETAERTAEKKKLVGQELVHYKIEKSLDELIPNVYIPFEDDFLVAPIELPEEQNTDEKLPKNTDNEKHEWKSFSTEDGELTMDFPDNLKFFPDGVMFSGSSEGLKFMGLSQPRIWIQTKSNDDAALNTLAWANVLALTVFKKDSGYEINFLRKENFGKQSARIYAYTWGCCECKTEGILLVIIGKKNNYMFDIYGANEQDAQIQHFLKSLKFNGSE